MELPNIFSKKDTGYSYLETHYKLEINYESFINNPNRWLLVGYIEAHKYSILKKGKWKKKNSFGESSFWNTHTFSTGLCSRGTSQSTGPSLQRHGRLGKVDRTTQIFSTKVSSKSLLKLLRTADSGFDYLVVIRSAD